MKKYIGTFRKVIFSVMTLLLPGTVHAQFFDASLPGKKMTLQQCFDLAEQQNLSLQAVRKTIERAKVMEGTAWDVDKTEVAFSQNPASSGDTDNGLTFSKSRLNVSRQQLKQEIASTYYAMLYQTYRLSILQRLDSILNRYCDIAGKRYKAGETRQLEVLTSERLRDENQVEMRNVKSEAENQQMILMNLLNSDQPILPSESHLIILDSSISSSFNYQQTADAQYQQDRLKVLDQEIKSAKTGYAPSLSLALRSQLLISSWDPYHIDRQRFTKGNFFGFEIGVGVPLFYGATKAKVKAARKDRELAELNMQQERREKERDYRLGYNRLQNATKKLQYYSGENIDKANEIVRLSTTEYENGEINYVEYVNALNEAIDMRMKQADVVNEYNEAVLALMALNNSL